MKTPSPRAAALLLTSLALCALAPSGSGAAPARRATKTVKVGALLSLTGGWATLGQASKAALEIGAAEINAEFERTGGPSPVRLEIEDTELVPEKALEKLRALDARGVRVVVGPQSSAELAAVREFADARGIVLISQGSTSSALAIPGDNAFRLAPSDVHEGEAIAALLAADGVEIAVPAWRGDAGNEGLEGSTRSSFAGLGGAMTDGVRYDAATTDFAATVAALSAQVAAAKAAAGADHVAVFLAAFDEAAAIFRLAQDDPVLSSVRWYGTDGVALSQALLNDAEAAAFAAAVGFPTPTFGLDASGRDVWGPLAAAIEARVGFAPDAFALAAYDALWIGVLARHQAKGNSAQRLRDAVMANANRYWGATGSTRLDAAGDRRMGNYDFFGLRETDGQLRWVVVASFTNGVLTRPAGLAR